MKITDILISFIALLIWLVFLTITLLAMMVKAILQGITLIFTQFYESIVWCITDDIKQYTFRKYILKICINLLLKLCFKKGNINKDGVIYNGQLYTPRVSILLTKLKHIKYKLNEG